MGLDEGVNPLGAEAALTKEDVERTDHVVAVMGAEPIVVALEAGADVVVAGRTCDDCIFAAYPICKGFPRPESHHLGKLLECASLVVEPEMVKETILGTVREDSIEVEPMHPDQRCTPRSFAAHSMYERVDPHAQALPGGVLDSSDAVYEPLSDRSCRVSGVRFRPDPVYRVKLEGAGKIGYRGFSVVGVRDPRAIGSLDPLLDFVDEQMKTDYPTLESDRGYKLLFHVYGRNGVMGELEPGGGRDSHELCIVSEVLAPTQKEALDIANLLQYRFLFGRFPGQKHSGGGAALIVDEALQPEHAAYRWRIDHLLAVDDPLALFPMEMVTVGS